MNLLKSLQPLASVALAGGLLLAASQANAHAAFVSAMPAANSTGAAPKQVTIHLSEGLSKKLSGFELMKADGSKVPVTTSVSPKDHKTLVGSVSGNLAPGTYMVMWHAVAADDGHRSKGDFNFTVH